MISMPKYLVSSDAIGHTYGTLMYDQKDNNWIIKGEPAVVQMAKRLFPGSSGRGRGTAIFKCNRRTNGDLNWLMLRYPLDIVNKEKWEQELGVAVKHVVEREKVNANPLVIQEPATFMGSLREFQKTGVGFMKTNRKTLLADDMGLGKTIQAMALIAEEQSYPALIVVQPHLIDNWVKELGRFLSLSDVHDQKVSKKMSVVNGVHIINGLKPYTLPKAQVYIVHYGVLRGWKNELPAAQFKAVVFDEIQELRHSGTEKYSAASLLSESCDLVLGLSGTPIYNKGGEIWNVLNILDYHCLGDWDSFTREWCYGYGSDTVKDPLLLNEHLKREGLLLRRTKDAVLDELPSKIRSVQTVDTDDGLFSSLIREAKSKAEGYADIKDQLEKGRVKRQIIEATRQATGIAKANDVCIFVRTLLEENNKVILFAYHHSVFDIYMEKLSKFQPVRITGAESRSQKSEAVEKFMNDETNIIIISLRACSGLNLQKANCVVFGELDWSPAIHSQAEDRAHRMGQKDSVLCYYLVSSQGSDEDIQEALGLKVSQFVGVMGDTTKTVEEQLFEESKASEYMSNIIERLTAYKKS